MELRDELLGLLRRGDVTAFNEVSRRRRQLIDLSEADLTGAILEAIDFRGAILDGAKLVGARLAGADFQAASLRFANLQKADLEGANLAKANLYSAYFSGARLSGASIHGADLASAVFPEDISAAEIRLGLEIGTRLRHDPTVGLLRRLLDAGERRRA